MEEAKSVKNAEHYTWGKGCEGWHLLKRNDMSVIMERVPPGMGEVSHYHEKARQLFFIVEGKAAMKIQDRSVILEEHNSIEIPPGTVHQFVNQSDNDVRFLVISVPASHGDRVGIP